ASTNSFGSSDLDLRPAGMARFVLGYQIQECPQCGYVSTTISDKSTITTEWLKTEAYITCDGIDFKDELAQTFYKRYKISYYEKNDVEALWALLKAAWACDDKNDNSNAMYCRRLAVPLISHLIEQQRGEKADELRLMKIDILRRAGMFDKLLSECSTYVFANENRKKILAFQLARAREKDMYCYTVENAVANIVEPQIIPTEEQLHDYVYPEDVLEPIYVMSIYKDLYGLILEREYLELSEKWKNKCHLASDDELKGKHLGPYCQLKSFIEHCCKKRKGIPWLKDESRFKK
ncbi:hypothetical protein IJ556_04835, partial [bacterium]|nr:hypothetical protein [bacterium]